jgi:hypothetical protein
MRTLLLIFATACLAIASAADMYKVNLFYPSLVGETELQPGNCKLTVEDGKVMIQQGRKKVEATVKVETGDSEYKRTSVRYANGDGEYRISEIRIGGTTTKLVFN